jgi:hypothetical protein
MMRMTMVKRARKAMMAREMSPVLTPKPQKLQARNLVLNRS